MIEKLSVQRKKELIQDAKTVIKILLEDAIEQERVRETETYTAIMCDLVYLGIDYNMHKAKED